MNKLYLSKKIDNEIKFKRTVKIGYSWTILFFGFVALLIRKQYKEGLISLLLFFFFIFYPFYVIFLSFVGNKMLLHDLLMEEYIIDKEITSKETILKAKEKDWI